MKMILVGVNSKFIHSNLAIYELNAYLEQYLPKETQDNFTLELCEYTINQSLEFIVRDLYQRRADCIAFSCYIWNRTLILQVAERIKQVAPEINILFGGPEVSYDSTQFLAEHPFVDMVIVGEGEETLLELVENGIGDALNTKGIAYRTASGEVIVNPPRPLLSLDTLPFAYQDLKPFENRILYYESSRGCPFSCSYCLSSVEESVRFRSLELVEKELDYFISNKVSQVKFVDRTFNCNPKRAREIWRYLTERDNGVTNFHFEVGADLIEDEDIALFRKMRPGLIQLEIGLQSTNEQTIQKVQRVMDIPKLKTAIARINKLGNIHQHLDLIAGLPYEDYESFQRSFDEAYAMQPQQLQLGFLKLLRGSALRYRAVEFGIQYSPQPPYEVLKTNWISFDELLELKKVEEMVEVYHNSGQFVHTLSFVLSHFPRPFTFFYELGKYYESEQLFGIGCKRQMRYTILRTFLRQCEERFSQMDYAILDDLLLFDYYLRENAKSRPEWAQQHLIDKAEYHAFFKAGGNDEIDLHTDGYDSKVAARRMHIEPIVSGALKWIAGADQELLTYKQVYALYDYDNRNPLTNDATVVFLTYLWGVN